MAGHPVKAIQPILLIPRMKQVDQHRPEFVAATGMHEPKGPYRIHAVSISGSVSPAIAMMGENRLANLGSAGRMGAMSISRWLGWMMVASVAPCGADEAWMEEVRLNEIQAIGSHNSYHVAPPKEALAVIGRFHAEGAKAWNYTHPGLDEQLEREGLRQFELDVYADPEGGLFAKPMVDALVRSAGLGGQAAFDPEGVLKAPGFKVLHVPDLDCWSHVPTLKVALGKLLAWSDATPGHVPVAVLVECKDAHHKPLPTVPVEFTRQRLMELEKEILEVIPRQRCLVPDDVRKGEAGLPQALRRHGWPMLRDVRGKFIFLLDNTGVVRDRYLEGNTTLEGRLMFASAPTDDHPAAGWFKCNDPRRDFARIQDLVRRGFLVRTRSDSGGVDPELRVLAFESGAQWVSTDHFSSKLPAATRVAFDGGTQVRRNPLAGGK